MAWTTADDVIGAWIGDDAPTDLSLLGAWIDRAERLIRFRVPGIQARIDEPEEDLLENVRDVVVSMVTRKFRNPEGIRQNSVSTGPFTEQRTYGGDNPGELVLLDAELALLSPVGSSTGAFTIDMIPSTSRFSPDYVDVWPWV